MPIKPQEFVMLLLESGIPDEVKDAIIYDFLPSLDIQDIQDLIEILQVEQSTKKDLEEKLNKKLASIHQKML